MYGISACGIVNEKQWYSNRFVESMIVSLFPPPPLPAPSLFFSPSVLLSLKLITVYIQVK